MNSHTSLVAQQTRLSEWAEMVRNCQNRPLVNNGELGFFRKYPFSLLNIQNCVIRYR